MNDPPPPRFLLEKALDQAATYMAMSFARVRAETTQYLMRTLMNIRPVIPFGAFLSESKEEIIESFNERCWKCGGVLERRRLGWYCPRCQRYRRFKPSVFHWIRRGGGH